MRPPVSRLSGDTSQYVAGQHYCKLSIKLQPYRDAWIFEFNYVAKLQVACKFEAQQSSGDEVSNTAGCRIVAQVISVPGPHTTGHKHDTYFKIERYLTSAFWIVFYFKVISLRSTTGIHNNHEIYASLLHVCYFCDSVMWPTAWAIKGHVNNSMELSPSREAISRSAIQEFIDFYGARRAIIISTRVPHWSLSCARLIQFIPPYPTSLRSILILSSRLCLDSPILFFCLSNQNPLCSLLSPRTCYIFSHLILPDLFIPFIFGGECKL
jgi:hypothetical protein